ncbi:MAG: aminopeptidase [Armatimonadetes bacterium]|nr:aminopeptidase [Armatimonadota bacterium]
MKLFISADIEGISGVTNDAQASQTGPQFAEARRWMTGDVNAAIEGAIEAGVTQVLVKDAHGWALNLLPDGIDERATLLQGWGVEDGMMEGLTEAYGLAFLVGYHPRAGTPDGVLSHTWSGALRRLVVNGIEMGEMGLSALFAGALGVPIALVTTCEAGSRQARELLPWVETASVKRGITRFAAELIPIKRAQDVIRDAARRAVERRGEMEPLQLQAPFVVRTTWSSPGMAQTCAAHEGLALVDEYTVEFSETDQLAALRRLRQVFRIAQTN